jgi:CheY-like chemotaxis protein
MGHELTVDMVRETIIVNGDLTRLTQVMGNLLNNAAKYTNRGGRISLAVEVRGHEVAIRVRDSGIGILAEHLSRVFELFSQVESALTRSRGGLGIGLSLARALVELHGGRITAASDGPGQGAEFTVHLPVVAVTAPEITADTVAGQNRSGNGKAPFRPRRVLVVDDNADVAKSLESVLVSAGHEVRVANDGARALDLAEEYRPEAVVLDIGMPDMNGYEVCRRIRERPWADETLMVACTGWGRPSDRMEARAAGFDHHLVKPADPEKLLDLIG